METITPFPISKTKIVPPQRRAELISRSRLIETLYDLLNKKLTLISAPAGYGKTSLLIDLADQSEIPVCWLTLDMLDQDPQRFLTYFVACIRERFPSFGVETLRVLNQTASIEKENERLAVSSTNEIYQVIREHFAIVLDDYQFIDPIPEIRSFVNRFIQLAGEHCHVVLASRTLPSLAELHLLLARDQVGGLSLEDLAFLPEEIQALFSQNAAQSLSLEEAKELADVTDGWITSISLTGLSFTDGRIQKKTPAARTGVDLSDYFSREVLERQSPEVRDFLILTAIFDDVEIDVCRNVLEPLFPDRQWDWKKLLNVVQKNNLFAIPVGDGDGLAFRYHHLFQDYLQAKLQEEHAQAISAITTRLASFYKERREWEKAHRIYEGNNDLGALVTLIEEAGTYFIRNGRIATLGNWLERLPVFLIQNNPKLLSLHGAIAHIRGETQTGIALLTQAENQFRRNQDYENLAVTLVRRASAQREAGDYACSLADADEAIALTQNSESPLAQYNLAAALRVKGMALFRLGRTVEAPEWLENSLKLFSFLKDRDYVPILEMELGAVHHALGNHEIAIKSYLGALKKWEATGNLGWQASLLNNLGVLYHQDGEVEQAFRIFEQAIDCARKSGSARTQAVALSSLGDLLIDLREIKHASECFEQALNIATRQDYSFLVFYASVARARIFRLENQFALAEMILEDLATQLQPGKMPAEEALFRMEYGCLLLHMDRAQLAVKELTRSVSLHERDGRTLEMNIGRLWLAAALISSGQAEAAQSLLKALASAYGEMKEPVFLQFAAGDVRGWFEQFKSPPETAAALKKMFSRASQFDKNIPTLRRKLRQVSKSAFISPPHLKIQAFGPAQVLISGKKVSLSDWQTRETRDLFFFFLQSSPQVKDDLAATFWPDISPARLKMRFKTNMYRLRHAVGQNIILFEGERYLFNHDIDYEYDVENFKKYLEQANAATNPRDSQAFLQAAIDLVQGPYLADVDTEWAAVERTRLELQYHAALIRLGELHLDTNQAAQALEVCQLALKSDPLLEEAYRLSMRAYAMLGDRSAIARVFQTCSSVLNAELGVKPARETERLYRKLV